MNTFNEHVQYYLHGKNLDSRLKPPIIRPPAYLALCIVAMFALALVDSGTMIPATYQGLRWIGVVPVLIGFAIAANGVKQFRRAGTNLVPLTESSALVTGGIFRWSRNPMYLGFVLGLAGIATMFNSWFGSAVLAVFYLVMRYRFIWFEEVLMAQTFGSEYLDYKRQVRRWL